ncbi:MAG: hypothetical protein HUU20_25825 [Pirellulales bacterium]|nr:hypothetical protein [Pirellulales bacterium]
MTPQQLADRVTRLEAEFIELRAEVHSSRKSSGMDWRRAVEQYAGDEDLLNVFRDAMKLREADRKRTQQK